MGWDSGVCRVLSTENNNMTAGVCTVVPCPHVKLSCVPVCACVTNCHFYRAVNQTGWRGGGESSDLSSSDFKVHCFLNLFTSVRQM